jgi:hypothetical protein
MPEEENKFLYFGLYDKGFDIRTDTQRGASAREVGILKGSIFISDPTFKIQNT